MTPATIFRDRRVAIFGLGGSGIVTAQALMAGGATVAAWDDGEKSRAEAEAKGIPLFDLRNADWSTFAALVLSPGVPLTHPVPHWSVRLAKLSKVEIIGDIELFCRERQLRAPDAPFVAVTGTNGKSTTTALIAHLFEKAGHDVQMGGNIGRAVLSLEPPERGRFHVIEISSFQIDLTPSLAPTIGVMLNVAPDHLDRHGTLENYAAIKERLVTASETAIVGVDDDLSRGMAARREAAGKPTVRVSAEKPLEAGIFLDGSVLTFARAGRTVPVVDLNGIASLRGGHNAQNAAAALAAVTSLGVNALIIRDGMPTFAGLPHRMEEVGRRGNTLFINDSKATNADSTEKALLSFENIHWILGGRPKEGGIEGLRPHFGRIVRAYLIGEAAGAFAATLGRDVPHLGCGTMERAVAAAGEAAAQRSGEQVMLLSPACASYDQYKNFEMRGNHFRDLVRALPGVIMSDTGAL